ncbi:unnamed protein product [Alopecurus aequalis]
MSLPGRVVHLTRCEGVAGFSALLNVVLPEIGCEHYPEYIVHEEHRAYGLGQFMCQVNFVNPGDRKKGPRYFQHAYGIGITVEQAVQEAANSAIGYLRYYDPYLGSDASAFTHYPAVLDSTEGTHVGIFTAPNPGESARYRALAALAQALDARARQWYMYAMNARECHFQTLMAIEPLVTSGIVGRELLQPPPLEVSPLLASPPVGGVWAPRGTDRVPRGSVHLPPFVCQPPSVRRFTGPVVPMSQDIGFY